MSKASVTKVYGYRWIVLLVFMCIAAIQQILWITFAPIASFVATGFSVSALDVAILSLIFMVVYLPVSIPSAYVIDSKGFRFACGVGAIITAVFAVLRAFAPSFILLLVFQAGIAVGQPFVFNSPTKLARRWFPAKERGLATGLGTMAIFLGIMLGMLVTPFAHEILGFFNMMIGYAAIAVITALLFLFVAKERPPTPPEPSEPADEKMMTGLRRIVGIKQFIILEILFFIGLGIFNGVATWIEEIFSTRLIGAQAGILAAVMVLGGIFGAAIIPELSDKYQRRKPFILLAVLMAAPFIFVLAFYPDYNVLLVSAFLLGFFLMPALPLGLQAGAEMTAPVPEGTSAGLLMIFGQLGGIVLILAMQEVNPLLAPFYIALLPALYTPFFPAMILLLALDVLALLIALLLRETAKRASK